MPRTFFETHVKPNYADWIANPLDERLAKNAIGDANSMAARVFRYWQCNDPSMVYSAQKEGQYRSELAARVCEDFGLVRDVADAHKHFLLDRPTRRLSRADQTGLGRLGWGEARWGESRWGSPPELVVTLDNGTKRPLTAIMANVMAMWERLLLGWGL